MKKITLFLAIVIVAGGLFGQENTPNDNENKNEINIGYFNAFNLSGIQDLGLGYKHTFKKGALRFGSSVFLENRKDASTYNSSVNTLTYYYSHTVRVNPRIGYEFHQNYNKTQFFWGFDLKGVYENYNRDRERNNATTQIEYNDKRIEYGGGISPVLGFKYQINNKISISTETSFDAMIVKTEEDYRNDDRVNTDDATNIMAKLNPLGIFSINIHF